MKMMSRGAVLAVSIICVSTLSLEGARSASAYPVIDGDRPANDGYTISVKEARQTPDGKGIRVRGRALENALPQYKKTVIIWTTVAGKAVATESIAGLSLSDVPGDNGFDVTAPHEGPGGYCVDIKVPGREYKDFPEVCSDSLDRATGFEANEILYDVDNVTYDGAPEQVQIDKATEENNSDVTQTFEVSRDSTATSKKGWSDTYGVKVTVSASAKFGVPLIGETKVTVTAEGSASYTQNGEVQETETFKWRKPVVVPPHKRVEMVVVVTQLKASVPYTLKGYASYTDGSRVPATISGVFTGVNHQNLQVKVNQFDLR